MLIDVEAMRSPRRGSLQISFRRNDNDRRPARPFIRPNDQAPTWEQREAESARRLQAITAKREEAIRVMNERMGATRAAPHILIAKSADKAGEAARQRDVHARRVARRKTAILLALTDGAETSSDLSRLGICSARAAQKVCVTLRLLGLISSMQAEESGPKGGIPQVTYRLTDAGREVVRTGAFPQ